MSFVLSKQKTKLNKGTAIYTKGMNWLLLAYTSFPVWTHTHNLFAITAIYSSQKRPKENFAKRVYFKYLTLVVWKLQLRTPQAPQ